MTKSVGIFEAKTHLSDLVDQVSRGSEVIITRHGKPSARLVPITPERNDSIENTPENVARRRQALQELRNIARRLKLNPTHGEIKSWINEGRE